MCSDVILILQEGAVRLLKLPEGTVTFGSSGENKLAKERSEVNDAAIKSKVGRAECSGNGALISFLQDSIITLFLLSPNLNDCKL